MRARLISHALDANTVLVDAAALVVAAEYEDEARILSVRNGREDDPLAVL